MWQIFGKKQQAKDGQQTPMLPLRVVVMGRDDNATIGFRKVLVENLSKIGFLNVLSEESSVAHDFLASGHKNFFDFFDNAMKVLKKHIADVVVCFEQQNNNVCFNFLTQDMYVANTPPFFSALHTLYLPVSYFQKEDLPPAVVNLLAGTCIGLSLHKDERYRQVLGKIVNVLSKNKKPQGIEKAYMPHILLFLALNFLASKTAHFEKKDVNLVLSLINSAYQLKTQEYDAVLEGGLLSVLGQMYQCGAHVKNADASVMTERAIESYRKALKYFNRYIFPYDYGRLCVVLAKLYFTFFKLSDERQALRDAIFYMREAEKIFTVTGFPKLWADIQGDLGEYLTHSGVCSGNKEIVDIAIQHYKNRQRVYEREANPDEWGCAEKNIADAYYYIGKNTEHSGYLEKASVHYFAALDAFHDAKDKARAEMTEVAVQKTNEKILRLKNK